MKLSELAVGAMATVTGIGGAGSFRRRLLELGIVPGTRLELSGIAPLGDPLKLLIRGSNLSIRRAEALSVEVTAAREDQPATGRAGAAASAELIATGCARETP